MYLSNVAALDGDIDRRVARSVAMTRCRKLSRTARSSVDASETPQRRTRASIIWMVQTVRHSSALSLPCPALPKLMGGRSIHDGRVTFTISSRTRRSGAHAPQPPIPSSPQEVRLSSMISTARAWLITCGEHQSKFSRLDRGNRSCTCTEAGRTLPYPPIHLRQPIKILVSVLPASSV